uniref:Uncharacterized protein n=1 Tax=Anguilla anguilla TaxID=7936 RepID=A0A0E9WBP9_ANGAN
MDYFILHSFQNFCVLYCLFFLLFYLSLHHFNLNLFPCDFFMVCFNYFIFFLNVKMYLL